MPYSRWWHVAVIGVSGVMLGLLALLPPIPTPREYGYAGLALLVLGWFALGKPAFAGGRAALAFGAIIVVASALLVAGLPSLAMVQALAMPLLWSIAPGVRSAIAANIALVTAITIGYIAGLGPSPGVVLQAVVIEGLSLAFSIAFGSWIARVHELSDERARLLAELRTTQERLAAVSREAGAAAERERWARDLHDTVAQDITGLVLLAQRAAREANPRATLALLEESARGALAETRALVAAQSPVDLEAGLAAALTRLTERFERESGLRTELTVDADVPTLPRDAEVVLLRCAQESLANVRKHAAGATRVELRLALNSGGVALHVADDGPGFDPSAPASGFGLPGLRERLAAAGGELAVRSVGGARVTCSLPLGAVRDPAASGTGAV